MDKYERNAKTNALMCILPYPRTWFDGLADKRLDAIYQKNLSKMIARAIEEDEKQVRIRAGLDPNPSEQLTLQI